MRAKLAHERAAEARRVYDREAERGRQRLAELFGGPPQGLGYGTHLERIRSPNLSRKEIARRYAALRTEAEAFGVTPEAFDVRCAQVEMLDRSSIRWTPGEWLEAARTVHREARIAAEERAQEARLTTMTNIPVATNRKRFYTFSRLPLRRRT